MSTDGVLACTFTKGTVNGEKFLDFILGTLLAEMLPFDGENPRSILVLDNCSIHHMRPVTDTLKQMGDPYTDPPPHTAQI